jgi:hypothetical protein
VWLDEKDFDNWRKRERRYRKNWMILKVVASHSVLQPLHFAQTVSLKWTQKQAFRNENLSFFLCWKSEEFKRCGLELLSYVRWFTSQRLGLGTVRTMSQWLRSLSRGNLKSNNFFIKYSQQIRRFYDLYEVKLGFLYYMKYVDSRCWGQYFVLRGWT